MPDELFSDPRGHAPTGPSGRLVDTADRGRIERRTGAGTGAIRSPRLLEGRPGEAGDPRLRARHHGQGRPQFVPPEDRIATFDQDGTLWVEHPLYTQAMFALDRVHALAPQHPEWASRDPFKAVLANDMAAIAGFSERDWAEIVFLTHAGMSPAAFQDIAGKWLASAKHPRFKRLYTELVYQPMRRGAGLSARQPVRDLHRHRRRAGFRAQLRPARLRHPDAEGGRDRASPRNTKSPTASRS